MTLLPGTIVLTGGPPRVAGVGDDDDRVQAGDTVIARIDPIGSLRNIVI
ncbi:MAG: fumarylacetoacetate hydrolase family protein [Phycisphaerales bacterium]|nr:fumarylacetoacetate hydrolase family protein [Phycisphaerales bacterium]